MESNRGVWSEDEHDRFLEAIQIYPHGPWRQVAEFVGTRDVRQVQTHAQKYYEKINRHTRGLRKERRSWVRPEHRMEGLPLSGLPPQPALQSLVNRVHEPKDGATVRRYTTQQQSRTGESYEPTQVDSLQNSTAAVLPTLAESLDILLECLSDD